MCQGAKIITLDALWSDVVYGYFKRQNMVQRVIENTFVPDEKRCHYIITNAPVIRMFQEILDDLRKGRNILLATMSSAIGHDLITYLQKHHPDLGEDHIIYHHSKQDDKLKRSLNDVDSLWSKAKLVIHTPSVETVTLFLFFLTGIRVYSIRSLMATPGQTLTKKTNRGPISRSVTSIKHIFMYVMGVRPVWQHYKCRRERETILPR